VNLETNLRTALVTGGSSGIGLAIARALAAKDYRVAVVARDAERLQRAVVDIGPRATWYAADLSHRESVEAAIASISKDLGHIDVLINNAGLMRSISAGTPLAEAEKLWDEVLDGNLKSTFLITLASLPHLSSPGGRIVNISSIAAQAGSSRPGGLAYSAAKGGVQGFTLSLARELGSKGITVNAVAPGFIPNTRFFGGGVPEERVQAIVAETPVGRAGNPEDIANAVCWLVSREASFVTGTTISVNGGWRVG
jgi:3-oxoacyl-[acyl-carrier protein] reductase